MRGGVAPRGGGVAPRMGSGSSYADKPKMAQKRIACKFLKLSGFCERGNECRFAHDQLKKNLAKKTTIISHKDELCLNYQEGNCKFKERCNYAHGEHELTDKIECNPLYKTTMCKSGPDCQKNENCAFAHDETELRSVTTQDLAKLKKNVPCKNLECGYCPQGDTCPYKHDNVPQVQSNKQQDAPRDGFISIQQMMDMFDYDPSKPNFRTTLCKNWLEKKDCSFGARCNHAHKEADMKALPESEPGYKDTLCKYIEEDTDCKWADKCKFAHGLKELMKYTKMRPGMNRSQCKSFVERKCLYGINCSFQHIIPGEKLDWKVARCKNGEDCKFGLKCAYAHNDAEVRTRDENAEHIELRNNIETVHRWKQMGCNIQQMFANLLEQSKAMMQGAGVGAVNGQQNNNMMMNSDDMMNEMMNNQSIITNDINQQIGGGTNMINNMRTFNMNDTEMMDIMPRSNPSLPINNSVMPITSPNAANTQGLIGGKKAELCPIWMDEGTCTRCNCIYAHGHKELSQLQALEVMKTEMENRMPMAVNNRSMGVVGAGNMSNVSIGAGNMSMAAGNNMGMGNMGMGAIGASNMGIMGPSTSRPVCPFKDVDEPAELDGKYKVVMCEFNNDNCKKGPRCYFAHSYAELHYYRAKQVPNYKRSLCKSWEEGGNCQWNKTCMFAHGSSELRGMDSDLRSC